MSKRKEILEALDNIALRVNALLETKPMIRGSFGIVYRRCGKPVCWCADPKEKGHECARISWTEHGTSHTLTINDENRDFVKALAESYRLYRRNRRQLRDQEKMLEKLLDHYENQVIGSSGKY
jgi:hypothetical protein